MMIRDRIGAVCKLALASLNIDVEPKLTHPNNPDFGDLSTNVALQCAKKINKNPMEVAQLLASELKNNSQIDKVEVVEPGFVNIYLSNNVLIQELENITKKGLMYGRGENKKRSVIVEFSSPNIAKPFTIGHLRSTAIGDSIAKILNFYGYKVFTDNHIGDWGTQFGKLILEIKNQNNGDIEKTIKQIDGLDRPVKRLVELYVEFHKKAEENPSLNDQARLEFKLLEKNNKEQKMIWQKCIDWSWREFDDIYKKLNIKFTENYGKGFGESNFVSDKKIVQELKEKTDYRLSNGAELVFFPNDKLPPLMIKKQDGTSLYATRDLGTDYFRKNNKRYGENPIIINEVGIEQTLYFQQLFEIEHELGWFRRGERIHVKHGHYRFKDKKMSTRKGDVIWLEDVLKEAVIKAERISRFSVSNTTLEANDPFLRRDVSHLARKVQVPHENTEKVAYAAIKWNDLKRESGIDVSFDWDEILNMNGNSGPYMLYTYVRTLSVLTKSSTNYANTLSNKQELNKFELNIIRLLYQFPEVIETAAINYSPHVISNYSYNLAQAFNSFYGNCKIVGTDIETQMLRIKITKATSIIIKQSLMLLGIETVQTM